MYRHFCTGKWNSGQLNMNHKVIGLDISEEQLTAVVVEQKAGQRKIVSYAAEPLDGFYQFKDKISSLLDRVNWERCSCVVGLTLGLGSLRNIALPFQDRKSINQTLSFELEDLLITPLDEQIIEYDIVDREKTGSKLLIAGVEKETLGGYLQDLKSLGCLPKTVTLRIQTCAEQIIEQQKPEEDFLVLEAQSHSFTMAIGHLGKVVMLRKLSYTDQMVTASPFEFDVDEVVVGDFSGAEEVVTDICMKIKHSISSFNFESGFQIQPEKIFITGSLSDSDFFREKITEIFQTEVTSANLRKSASVYMAAKSPGQYQDSGYDHALGLALSGFEKKPTLNFLKEEFGGDATFFRSKKAAVAATVALFLLLGTVAGYLFNECRTLQKSYDHYTARAKQVYQDSFPDAVRIVDPFKQMQIQVRNLQKTSTAPAVSGEKRTLNILADISKRIPAPMAIHVTRLIIDKETVRFKGTTDTFNNVNVIQKYLRNSPKYENVDIVSATADQEKEKVRFEIKLKLREVS